MFVRSTWLVVTVLPVLASLAAQCSLQPLASPEPSLYAQADASQLEGLADQSTAGRLGPVFLAQGEKLRVVATTNIVADIVRNVGGDKLELVPLLPVGSDPHTFQLAPADVAAVADAHLVFVNGLGLEAFLAELLANAGGRASVVPVSTGIETRQIEAAGGGGPGRGQTGPAPDPHVWLTPANAVVFVQNVDRALSAADPANADVYGNNARVYQAQLEELDNWIRAQIETIPADQRKMVTDHDAFGYYAERYGLEIIGAVIPAYSTNAEPSAQELAILQNAIDDTGVRAVFVGSTANPGLAKRLAEDGGIRLVHLYSDALGPAGSDAETYLGLLRYNTSVIVQALK
jgi:ABC-type Zn uptake system ZnuABC Zn-binding protein ZnuA